MQVVVKIFLYRVPYTISNITEEFLSLPNDVFYKSIGVEPGDSCIEYTNDSLERLKCNKRCTVNALFLRPFMQCLRSEVYRMNVILNLNNLCGWPANGTVVLKLVLEPPDLEIIDYAWNNRILRIIWTKAEIENAFSWLSTLGGAYSALGDYFENCAEEAHRISIRQYKLSVLLGDEALAARSKLYTALAYSQKGKLRTSRRLVRSINDYAIKTQDKRLNRMCQGVWAKLKYLRMLQKSPTKQGKGNGDGNNSVTIT